MRILVTGADGFVGSYLIRTLYQRDHSIIAGVLNAANDSAKYIEVALLNIVDSEQVNSVVYRLQPDAIIHLAAQSMVKTSWENPSGTVLVNTIGTTNIVKAVAQFSPKTKIITIGSSEEYGLTGKHGRPLTEDDYCLPQNPYAISKLAAGQIALQLAEQEKINVIHVRPFNHFGPHQREGFVVSDFASQIARMENGSIERILRVGDLSAQRDFTDVRDVIEAYVTLLEKNVETGIYNVCSGQPHTAEEILSTLLSQCKVEVEVQVDQEKFRPSNVPLFIGSAEKLTQATEWKPRRAFSNSIIETLEWWRSKYS
ncbi:GDP-mannose 4,6-dehydratase [Anaerospora hongkongensis]|uniref:GDP-mannose 4,6-dehydratase n=1 Tax=Anaerospora hongkongensis TaxID=244830 RepID=UPI00289E0265|nr:GDP-mannose 4,6-dehydratase [Anaerospora hongkongensis]